MASAAGVIAAAPGLDARRETMVRRAAWAVLALLFFDIWALHPFVALELRRLEPWTAALLFVGDGTCLLWFLWYFARHAVRREPLADKPLSPVGRPSARWFYVSLVLGLSFDLGATLYFGLQERREYAVAAHATATVTSVHTRHASKGLNWHMLARFRAADGREYETIVRLHLTPGEPFPPTLSRQTVAALQRGDTGTSIPVRYHPAWPARAWLDGVPEDENGLMWFSLAVIGFQGMITLLVGLLGYVSLGAARKTGRTPWWLDVHRAIPAAIQIVVMAYWGALMRAFG